MRNLAAVSSDESKISLRTHLSDHRLNFFCNAINDFMIG